MKALTNFLKQPQVQYNNFWKDIKPVLLNYLYQQHTLDGNWFNIYSDSRILQEVLRHTTHNSWNSNNNLYKFLAKLCLLITNTTQLQIIPKYLTINSEEATELTLQSLKEYVHSGTTDINAAKITICAVPKGKSYLKKLFKENTDHLPARITTLESLYQADHSDDFIAIFRDFEQDNPKNITVFCERPTEDLITLLITMLPHFLQLVPRETTEEYPELSEEDTQYNTKFNALMKIFELLFVNYNEDTTLKPSFITTLIQYINEYADLFDFTTAETDSFLNNLAAARNNRAKEYFENQYKRVIANIEDYERRLEDFYREKANTERELNANKLLNKDDVQAFSDTINNSKAIEVLTVTSTSMIIRVTAPFQYFVDEDLATQEQNLSSNYNYETSGETYLRKILHKIFVTREYKLITQAIIRIDIQSNYGANILSANVCANGNDGLQDYTEFPNPHLWHHNCWSAARTEMYKNAAEGNFELVVMQMIAAVQSINVAENASFINGLVKDIIHYRDRRQLMHIITEDGQTRTYDETVAHEKELEQANAIEQAKEQLTKASTEYSQVELPDIDWDIPETHPLDPTGRDPADLEGIDITNLEGGV